MDGIEKRCELRSKIALQQYCFANESITAFTTIGLCVAEVHVKAPSARPISDEAAAAAASTLAPHSVGWRMFQWLQRSLVPDRSVVD
jgi:hypothetical protein